MTKGLVAYSPGFGTKIHARTVAMDLHFVEPGKKHRELDTRKWPACRARQMKPWCNEWPFLAAVNALSADENLRCILVGMTGSVVRHFDGVR